MVSHSRVSYSQGNYKIKTGNCCRSTKMWAIIVGSILGFIVLIIVGIIIYACAAPTKPFYTLQEKIQQIQENPLTSTKKVFRESGNMTRVSVNSLKFNSPWPQW